MTVRDTSNGFKVLARKGSSVQEVFIGTTQMGLDDLKVILGGNIMRDASFFITWLSVLLRCSKECCCLVRV